MMAQLRPVVTVTLQPSPIENAPEFPPESWRLWEGGLAVTCDNGHQMSVDVESVAVDGVRSPSIGCPVEKCGWHVWGTLAEWSPPAGGR